MDSQNATFALCPCITPQEYLVQKICHKTQETQTICSLSKTLPGCCFSTGPQSWSPQGILTGQLKIKRKKQQTNQPKNQQNLQLLLTALVVRAQAFSRADRHTAQLYLTCHKERTFSLSSFDSVLPHQPLASTPAPSSAPGLKQCSGSLPLHFSCYFWAVLIHSFDLLGRWLPPLPTQLKLISAPSLPSCIQNLPTKTDVTSCKYYPVSCQALPITL